MKERWNAVDVEAEALLKKERYHILDRLLKSGNVEIRVVPKERLFLHGKAGVIHYPNAPRKSFIGSVNDSKSAFTDNYELVWQDDDPASADWVEAEFWALWNEAIPLPEAIIMEIGRVANRQEVTIEMLDKANVPAAAVLKRQFIGQGNSYSLGSVLCYNVLEHREVYGKARLLLADEVGVGKLYLWQRVRL